MDRGLGLGHYFQRPETGSAKMRKGLDINRLDRLFERL